MSYKTIEVKLARIEDDEISKLWSFFSFFKFLGNNVDSMTPEEMLDELKDDENLSHFAKFINVESFSNTIMWDEIMNEYSQNYSFKADQAMMTLETLLSNFVDKNCDTLQAKKR